MGISVSRAITHRSPTIGRMFELYREENNTAFIASGSVELLLRHFVYQPSPAYSRSCHYITMLFSALKAGYMRCTINKDVLDNVPASIGIKLAANFWKKSTLGSRHSSFLFQKENSGLLTNYAPITFFTSERNSLCPC